VERSTGLKTVEVAPDIALNPVVVEVVEDSHCMEPVEPPSVRVSRLVPAHNVEAPVIFPATVVGLTVKVAVLF
jgi:hypothetical protein